MRNDITDCAVRWDLKLPGGRVSGSDVVIAMVAMVAEVAVVEHGCALVFTSGSKLMRFC
jgi:hypothetical protein